MNYTQFYQHQLGRGDRRYTVGQSPLNNDDSYPQFVSSYLIDYNVAYMNLGNAVGISTVYDRGHSGMNMIGTSHTPTNSVGPTEIGGNAWASMNGSTQYLSSNAYNFTGSQAMTYFMVAKVTGDQGKPYFLMDGFDSGQGRHYAYRSDSSHLTVGSNVSFFDFPYIWFSNVNLWKLFEFHFNGAGSSVWINGVSLGTGNFGTGSTSATKGLNLGCRADGDPTSYGMLGGIARFVAYNKDVQGPDLTNLRNYFRQKYYIY